MSEKSITDIWYEEFLSYDNQGFPHCGLCGNRGVLDLSGIKTSGGYELKPIKPFCICPNGRAIKQGTDLEKKCQKS